MNTLPIPPPATLQLRRLDEAGASVAVLEHEPDQLSPAQRSARLHDGDWRQLYTLARDAQLAMSRETGRPVDLAPLDGANDLSVPLAGNVEPSLRLT